MTEDREWSWEDLDRLMIKIESKPKGSPDKNLIASAEVTVKYYNVSIGDWDMGRMTAENNHKPFETLAPLAFKAQPGRTYYLKIASYGKSEVDDFAIEGVSVETDVAQVTFLQSAPILKMPDEPMPRLEPPAPRRGPCEGATRAEAWLPEASRSRGFLELRRGEAQEGVAAKPLPPGGFVQAWVKAGPAASGDRVGQAFELLLGEEASGWVFSFGPGSEAPFHGNLKLKGRYAAPSFSVQGWKAGQWNDVRVARCADGKVRLFLKGREVQQALDSPSGDLPLKFRALGLPLQIAERPL